jgi:hypothetical protein
MTYLLPDYDPHYVILRDRNLDQMDPVWVREIGPIPLQKTIRQNLSSYLYTVAGSLYVHFCFH